MSTTTMPPGLRCYPTYAPIAVLAVSASSSLGQFTMTMTSKVPGTVEPLFQALGASVHVTPVMNGEDLQRGFKEAGM